jgi:hypothetical protein
MNDTSGSGTLRGLLAAAGIGILGGMLAAGAWLLVFTQFGIVPTGTAYPADWKLLTSTAQIEWLREHIVVVAGFTAVEYMVTHFSEYSDRIYMHFANAAFTGLVAALLYWYLQREHS